MKTHEVRGFFSIYINFQVYVTTMLNNRKRIRNLIWEVTNRITFPYILVTLKSIIKINGVFYHRDYTSWNYFLFPAVERKWWLSYLFMP